MNGLVISVTEDSGIIIDDKGKRYKFLNEEIKQGTVKNGSKVNFIDNNGVANDIYLLEFNDRISETTEVITKGFSNSKLVISNMTNSVSEKINNYTEGSKIKSMSLLAATGAIITILFSSVSNLITFAGIVLEMFALFSLGNIKNDMSFFIYRVKAIISAIIAMLILQSLIESFFIIISGQNLFFNGVKALLFLIAIIYSIYSIFRSYTKLSKAFNVSLFKISAYLYIIGLISPIIFISMKNLQLTIEAPYYLILAHYIVLIFAYLRIKDEKEE